MKRVTFPLLFCLILTMSACHPRIRTLVPVNALSPSELLNLFDQREREHRELKGEVSFSIHPLHGISQTINGILSFKKNDQFRFQGFDQLGATLLTLNVLDDQFKIWPKGELPLEGSLEENNNLRLRTGQGETVILNWNEWMKLIREIGLGGNPVAKNDELVFFENGEDAIICSILKIKGKQGVLTKKIWLGRLSLLPVKEELYQETDTEGRKIIGTLYFSDFNEKNTPSWPGKVRVKSKDGELEVEFLETNFSPSFPADYFKMNK